MNDPNPNPNDNNAQPAEIWYDVIVGPDDFVTLDYWVEVECGQLSDAWGFGPDALVDENGTVTLNIHSLCQKLANAKPQLAVWDALGDGPFACEEFDEGDWNGFALPRFTKRQADALMRHLRRDGWQTSYDEEHRAFILHPTGDEPEVWGEGDDTLYPIGSGAWAWTPASLPPGPLIACESCGCLAKKGATPTTFCQRCAPDDGAENITQDHEPSDPAPQHPRE